MVGFQVCDLTTNCTGQTTLRQCTLLFLKRLMSINVSISLLPVCSDQCCLSLLWCAGEVVFWTCDANKLGKLVKKSGLWWECNWSLWGQGDIHHPASCFKVLRGSFVPSATRLHNTSSTQCRLHPLTENKNRTPLTNKYCKSSCTVCFRHRISPDLIHTHITFISLLFDVYIFLHFLFDISCISLCCSVSLHSPYARSIKEHHKFTLMLVNFDRLGSTMQLICRFMQCAIKVSVTTLEIMAQ